MKFSDPRVMFAAGIIVLGLPTYWMIDKVLTPPPAAAPSSELVRVCNGRYPVLIRRDLKTGRLFAYSILVEADWLAADVTPDQACAGGQ